MPLEHQAGLRLHLPVQTWIDAEDSTVVDEPAVRLAEPVDRLAIVLAQHQVVEPVTVEVADAGDVPVEARVDVEVSDVADEGAVGLAEEVGDGAAVVAPQDVVIAVAVEVAGADDVPVEPRVEGEVDVADEAAVVLAEQVDDDPRIVAPQDVVVAVAVEVAGPLDDVADEAAVKLTVERHHRARIVAPHNVVVSVTVKVRGMRRRSGLRNRHIELNA